MKTLRAQKVDRKRKILTPLLCELTASLFLSLSLLQCGAGLQAAGGQAAAAHEETLPHGRNPLPPFDLPRGGLHLHPQTQVQIRLQEACSLETLVLMKPQDWLFHQSTGLTCRPACLGSPSVFCLVTAATWLVLMDGEFSHWIPFWEVTGCVMGHEWIPWKMSKNVTLTKNGFRVILN